VKFEVTNTSDRTIDVALFYLDAGFGLTPLLPLSDADLDNRLAAKTTKAAGPFKFNDVAVGWESAVLIAIPAASPREHFAALAQPSLIQARGLESPLGKLLEDAAFGRGKTRDLDPPVPTSDFVVKAISWQTVPPRS
jgi:hypothetical protein